MPWNLRKMFVENSWNPGCSISVTSQWACHDPKMLISHHYSRIFQISVIISPVVFTPQCIQSNPWGPKLTCNGDDTVIFGGYGHFRGEHGHGDSFKLSKIIANWENHWYIYIYYILYLYYIYICGPIYIYYLNASYLNRFRHARAESPIGGQHWTNRPRCNSVRLFHRTNTAAIGRATSL